jgi:hypothetical protein
MGFGAVFTTHYFLHNLRIGPTSKNVTWLEKLASDKHYSFVGPFLGCKDRYILWIMYFGLYSQHIIFIITYEEVTSKNVWDKVGILSWHRSVEQKPQCLKEAKKKNLKLKLDWETIAPSWTKLAFFFFFFFFWKFEWFDFLKIPSLVFTNLPTNSLRLLYKLGLSVACIIKI